MAQQDMLVNYVRGEECRIAIVEDGKLEEFYSERASSDLHVGNIYRGKVTNIEPSFQAAFIDFGLERGGFLHVTDLHPRYFPGEKKEEFEAVGQKTPRRDRPPIQQCLRRGQEILVQVLKEGLGSKGPTVTSYLSIPGRFLVMMPHMERHGVSRKIEDPEKRKQIHRILDELNPPEGFGFIVRTAGLDRPKTELKRDLAYLLRLWKDIERHMETGRGPAELFVESDLITRTLRDVVTSDVKRIVIDDRDTALRAKQFIRLATPRSTTKVIHYANPLPLFDAFDIERQIKSIHDRVVPMENGGSLVFDTTEAMVAIDVNSGKSRESSDAETNAYRTNLDAVDEIARQLRLRDLGGLIVLDLIDMYKLPHRRAVEKRFKDNLKRDRSRTKDLKISELGMLEMTRQRMRPSIKKSVFRECTTCKGAGLLMSLESVVLSAMRRLGVAMHAPGVHRVELSASAEALAGLLNRRREALTHMEKSSGRQIVFSIDAAAGPDTVTLQCFDEKNAPVDYSRVPAPKDPVFTEDDEIKVEDLNELIGAFEDLDEIDEAEGAAAEGVEPVGQAPPTTETGTDDEPPKAQPPTGEVPRVSGEEGGGRRRRRRGRRRGRGGGGQGQGPNGQPPTPRVQGEGPTQDGPVASATIEDGGYEAGPAHAPRVVEETDRFNVKPQAVEGQPDPGDAQQQGESGGRRRRRRGGRRHRRGRGGGGQPGSPGGGDGPPETATPDSSGGAV